jgi:hypothetical protein
MRGEWELRENDLLQALERARAALEECQMRAQLYELEMLPTGQRQRRRAAVAAKEKAVAAAAEPSLAVRCCNSCTWP